jgi:hypothetical protein
VLTAAVTFPLLYGARRVVYEYYVQNHLVGIYKEIWANVAGLHTIWDHIAYYPRSIVETHLGHGVLRLIGAVILLTALGLAYSKWNKRGVWTVVAARLRYYRYEFVMLGSAVIVPTILLTFDEVKSSVVGSIVVVPIILMVILLLGVLWRDRTKQETKEVSRRTAIAKYLPEWLKEAIGDFSLSAVGVGGIFAVALALFVVHGTARSTAVSIKDLRRAGAMNDAIVQYALDNNLRRPKLSVDRVADYIYHGTLDIVAFEKFQRGVFFVGLFGMGNYGIFATPRDVAMQLIEDSDIIVLTDPVLGRETPYPMNTMIKEYWDDMAAWTAQTRILIFSTEIEGIPHKVFVRPVGKLPEAPPAQSHG